MAVSCLCANVPKHILRGTTHVEAFSIPCRAEVEKWKSQVHEIHMLLPLLWRHRHPFTAFKSVGANVQGVFTNSLGDQIG